MAEVSPLSERAAFAIADDLRLSITCADEDFRSTRSVVRHLTLAPGNLLCSDAVVAFIQGASLSMAVTILEQRVAQSQTSPVPDHTFVHASALSESMLRREKISCFLHAMALEGLITRRVAHQTQLDPVFSATLQSMSRDDDNRTANLATACRAAQSRFLREHGQQSFPLLEMPAELVHDILIDVRGYGCGSAETEIARAELKLRADYVEANTRTALFDRLADERIIHTAPFPDVQEYGVALFLSTVARITNQTRLALIFALAQPASPRSHFFCGPQGRIAGR